MGNREIAYGLAAGLKRPRGATTGHHSKCKEKLTMANITRREFVVMTGTAAAAWALQPACAAGRTPIFPYGTHVYREPSLPLEQLAADLPILKKLGFSMVKIQESWSTDERHPGEIDLSRVERIVADARQAGLLVYFGVTMEQAPAWLWKKYPDATMVYEDGSPQNDPTQYLLASDGKPGPCWHHPQARAAAQRFIEAVGERLGHYENIAVWNVWQEIGLLSSPTRPGHRYFCYCTNTLAAFRVWLQARYDSLATLNAAWRTGFGEWNEVEPMRLYTPVPSMLDWRIFMEDVYLAEVLHWKAEAFRRSDVGRRPILAHTPGPTAGSTADWAYSRSVDIYGTSLYPGWGEPEDPDTSSSQRLEHSSRPYEQLWSGVMFKVDYVRSGSPSGNVWAAELQGGRAGGGLTPGRTPDAGDIRRWVLGAIGAGARGICFWNHRNEILWGETSGFGLLDRTGDSTARALEAARVGRAIQAEAELFTDGVVPQAAVGILVSERLYQFTAASDPAIVKAQCEMSVRGMYKALWEAGIAVDFVDAERLGERPAPYHVLLFPAPLLMSDTLANALATFVRAGGTLISEATAGRFDDYGIGRAEEMGPGLPALFGAEHLRLAAWQMGEKTAQSPLPPPWAVTGVGELAGHDGIGSLYLQALQIHSAEPLLKHGDLTVGCVNIYGKGRAILLGTLLGSAILDDESNGNSALVTTLVRAAGVKPDKVGALLQRRRVLGRTSARFLINPTPRAVRETMRFEGVASVSDLLNGPLKLTGGECVVEVGPLDILCLIAR
jgi:beta-galactosidase GanA